METQSLFDVGSVLAFNVVFLFRLGGLPRSLFTMWGFMESSIPNVMGCYSTVLASTRSTFFFFSWAFSFCYHLCWYCGHTATSHSLFTIHNLKGYFLITITHIFIPIENVIGLFQMMIFIIAIIIGFWLRRGEGIQCISESFLHRCRAGQISMISFRVR